MSFEKIKGQNRAIKMLQAGFIADRISHAYLFLGPEGIGKFKTALTFAQLLNCKNPQQGEPCDICAACQKAIAGVHPDIIAIRSDSSSIKINQIRQIQSGAYLKCYEGKNKVIIIDDAHLMTLEAANSLLKILEEPPSNTIMILISQDIKRMPTTILSRCQAIQFNPSSDAMMKKFLSDTENKKNIPIDMECDSIKDNIKDLYNNITKMGYRELFRWAEDFSKDKGTIYFVLKLLSELYRDDLVEVAAKKNIHLADSEVNAQIKKGVNAQKAIDKAYSYINYNANTRLVLEVLFLDLYHIEFGERG